MINKNNPIFLYQYIWEWLLFLIICILINKKIIIQLLLVIGIVIILLFFRNFPKEIICNTGFVSPSSSQVIKVTYSSEFNEINTYLSPFDIHFMIAPVNCKVIDIKNINNGSDAERLRYILEDSSGELFMLDQIISKPLKWGWVPSILYKNRCVSLVKIGDKLHCGERIGLIRFGSNMTYYLPKKWTILAQKDKKYKIGDTIAI